MDAVLFDLFGTIVPPYRREAHHRALRRIAEVLEASFEDVLDGWNRTWDERATGRFDSIVENLRVIVPSASDDQLSEAHRVYQGFTIETLVPKPGALEVLDWLVGQDIPLALVTNCAPDVPELWPHTRWSPRFDVTVFSCVVGKRKPDPKIYRIALDQLGVDAGAAVFVGDGSDRELEGAVAVGLTPVLVRNEPWEADFADEVPGVEGFASVDDMSGLVRVLSEL